MRDLSTLHEYLQSKAAGDVAFKAVLRKELLAFEFTVPGMLKAFFEKVIKNECTLVAPEWAVHTRQNKEDLVILLTLTAEQTKGVLWDWTYAVTVEALGTAAGELLKKLPPKGVKSLIKKWSDAEEGVAEVAEAI